MVAMSAVDLPTTLADDRARRVARSLDRIVWLRIDDDGCHGTVAGVRRRRPVHVRVDGEVARALAAAGVPTVPRTGRGPA